MSTDARYLSRQVVLVGYGRVGRRIADALQAAGVPFVVAEENREVVERLRAQRHRRRCSATRPTPAMLIQAHIAHARMLVIATPETIEVRQMVETARTLNPAIESPCAATTTRRPRCSKPRAPARVFVGESELATR